MREPADLDVGPGIGLDRAAAVRPRAVAGDDEIAEPSAPASRWGPGRPSPTRTAGAGRSSSRRAAGLRRLQPAPSGASITRPPPGSPAPGRAPGRRRAARRRPPARGTGPRARRAWSARALHRPGAPSAASATSAPSAWPTSTISRTGDRPLGDHPLEQRRHLGADVGHRAAAVVAHVDRREPEPVAQRGAERRAGHRRRHAVSLWPSPWTNTAIRGAAPGSAAELAPASERAQRERALLGVQPVAGHAVERGQGAPPAAGRRRAPERRRPSAAAASARRGGQPEPAGRTDRAVDPGGDRRRGPAPPALRPGPDGVERAPGDRPVGLVDRGRSGRRPTRRPGGRARAAPHAASTAPGPRRTPRRGAGRPPRSAPG